MALINANVSIQKTPAERTVELGVRSTEMNAPTYLALSARMCWDAALLCAWSVKGIHCDRVDLARNAYEVVTDSGRSFTRLFPDQSTRPVRSAAELAALPAGMFIGFVHGHDTAERRLRHVMIHVGDGWGVGNKNDCILRAGHSIGWERLDMRAFFLADRNFNGNDRTTMICVPIQGQTV
jgi:hypothetical protein